MGVRERSSPTHDNLPETLKNPVLLQPLGSHGVLMYLPVPSKPLLVFGVCSKYMKSNNKNTSWNLKLLDLLYTLIFL